MASAAAPVAALRSLAHRAGIYGLLAVVLAAALLFVPGFASPTNLANVVTQSAALGLVAIGQTAIGGETVLAEVAAKEGSREPPVLVQS